MEIVEIIKNNNKNNSSNNRVSWRNNGAAL